jgi:DNA-directed RNA polymerase subunit RPC12/RpoP
LSFLCPKCHRPFTKEIVKREPTKDITHTPPKFEGSRSRPFSVDTSKEVVEFTHYCRCKHCGHEWAETKIVKFDR